MGKKNKTFLKVFTDALILYFSNFGKFMKYMTFPVLGQIAGLLIIAVCTYFYIQSLPNLISKYQLFNKFETLVICSILVALPGMIILMKAFWEYLVAYGAVNSMLANMLKSGRVYDFDAHTELIKRRSFSFVTLWLLVGIFSILAILPIFWVPAGVIAIFCILIFQVFTYESELSPVGCVRKSFQLVKGHFLQTFILAALIGIITYFFIPQLFCFGLKFFSIDTFIANLILPLVNVIPMTDFNNILSYVYVKPIEITQIAIMIVTAAVLSILIQYTLPMRSLLWGLWYKELNGSLTVVQEKKKAKSSKKKSPSEKLMEKSHKKFVEEENGVKKLDTNILRRAMEKED